MALKQLTESVATSLANPDRLPSTRLEIRQVINRKAPIEFSAILETKQIVFLLGWVTARAKGDSRTQRSRILSFKGKYMFSPKASHFITLKSVLWGGHSHRHSPGGKYLSTDGHKIVGPGWLGAEQFLSGCFREHSECWVWAIAGVMVRKTQLCGAQCAHKPTLYHGVHEVCATKDIWLRNCAILFGIFSSKCSSSKMGDGKIKAASTNWSTICISGYFYLYLLLKVCFVLTIS